MNGSFSLNNQFLELLVVKTFSIVVAGLVTNTVLCSEVSFVCLQERIYHFTRAGVQSIWKGHWKASAEGAEGVGSGCAPSPENFCISCIKMVNLYAFPVRFIDTVLSSKRHPNQKGGCPDTLDTPLDPPLVQRVWWYCLDKVCIRFTSFGGLTPLVGWQEGLASVLWKFCCWFDRFLCKLQQQLRL